MLLVVYVHSGPSKCLVIVAILFFHLDLMRCVYGALLLLLAW